VRALSHLTSCTPTYVANPYINTELTIDAMQSEILTGSQNKPQIQFNWFESDKFYCGLEFFVYIIHFQMMEAAEIF
jgi:hypothetical protein